MFYIVCAILLAILIYKYLLSSSSYWQERGVKCYKPTILFGLTLNVILRKKSFFDILKEGYNQYENERYFGVYQFLKPILIINDLELIKKTAIKDFDSFLDHTGFSSEDLDPLWSKNLFSSKGQKWHLLRTTLSPAFTGSKMKMMFVLMNNCAEQFTKHFLEKNEDIITVEMRDVITRYTNDVIATCAFGVTCDSLANPENDFYKNGIETTSLEGFKGLKFFGYSSCPALMKLFGIKIISTSNGNFFRKLITDTIKLRNEKNITRPDMIHLLLQARKGLLEHEDNQVEENNISAAKEYKLDTLENKNSLELTDEDITAQAMIFLFGGFESSAVLMIYLSYEMAINVDIQNKVKKEIDDAFKKCDGKLTYDTLMGMKYLDMVISETLRKWPQGPMAERLCTKDYKIPAEKPGEVPLLIEKGTTIWYPLSSIQRDPKYYPNPEKFDPERFNDENKSKLQSETFLAFGIGPRNCLGSRFALLETKVLMFHMLSKFEIVPVKKTVIPFVQSKKDFALKAEGGMWLGLKKR